MGQWGCPRGEGAGDYWCCHSAGASGTAGALHTRGLDQRHGKKAQAREGEAVRSPRWLDSARTVTSDDFHGVRGGFECSSRKSATPTTPQQFVQVDLSGFLPKTPVNNNDLLMIYPSVLKCCTDSSCNRNHRSSALQALRFWLQWLFVLKQ